MVKIFLGNCTREKAVISTAVTPLDVNMLDRVMASGQSTIIWMYNFIALLGQAKGLKMSTAAL